MSDEKICPTCEARYPAAERFCPKDGSALRALDAKADLVGSVIGERYHVLQKLGEGGMGQVYLAEHVKMGRKSAVKVMNKELVNDADAIGRFNREAANASRINHQNVAGIYDFGETADGLTFLAMEYVEGRSLTSIVREEGALSPDRAAEITRQASLGLQSAHDMGIVHRDLKPDNIMIAQDKEGADLVKVVDFGIAKAAGGGAKQKVTQTGVIVGTPEYMSPEQVSGDELDGRSDTYSLALVAFHILTGQLPFDSGSTQESLFMRLTDEPASLADVRPDVKWPSDVQKVIRKALDPDREQRYQSAAVFGAELSAAVARMPKTAMRPSKAVMYNAATRLSTDSGIAIGTSSAPRTRRRLKTAGNPKRIAIIAGLSVIVVAIAVGVGMSLRGVGTGAARLAVLPFENRSKDTADAFLADGFAEELANRVSRVPQLSVLSNTAVRRVKNIETMSMPEVGKLLGATFIMSGSVKRVGGRLNVSVELARAKSGEKVWGDSYDRAESGLPALMRDIAVAAATGMLGTLPPDAQAKLAAPTQNSAAYELYLRGNQTRLAEGGAELGQSIAAYEGALALDPKFAAA
jgi:serine/threonine-protein kinase